MQSDFNDDQTLPRATGGQSFEPFIKGVKNLGTNLGQIPKDIASAVNAGPSMYTKEPHGVTGGWPLTPDTLPSHDQSYRQRGAGVPRVKPGGTLPGGGTAAPTGPLGPSGIGIDISGGTRFRPYDPNAKVKRFAGSVVGRNSAVLPPGAGVYDAGDGTMQLYNREPGLADMAETGPRGGNVSQFTMSPEQMADVEARRSAALPAQESLNRALNEANLYEGIHGADAFRRQQAVQEKMFLEKYGLGLKERELAMEAPLRQAQTAEATAKAGMFSGKNEVTENQTLQKRLARYEKMFDETPEKLAGAWGIRTRDDAGKRLPDDVWMPCREPRVSRP
jgi:hypothetical protein